MTRSYDLVAIDVDGTLLNSQSEISNGAAEAIQLVSDRGIMPVLVSGRSIYMLDEYIQVLEVARYYIGSGGASIATTDGDTIDCSPVSRRDAESITQVARQEYLGTCFHEATQQKCEIMDAEMRAHIHRITRRRVDFVEDVLTSTNSAPEKITLFGPRDKLEEVRVKLGELPLLISMTFSGPQYLEITHATVSKGSALKKLACHLEIPLTRVAAIGDQQNDISMFKVSGLAVAMGNAPQEVKSMADRTVPTNDNGGLAWALRELVLKP